MEKYPCPCCGYLTYPVPREEAIAYICPVCFWENDVFVTSDDEPSDENHGIPLRTAQENYRSFGACARTMLRYVREPKPEEIPQEKNAGPALGRTCVFSCSNAKDVLQPQLYGAAQAHLAVQRGVDGLDQRLAVAVERTAEGKVV